MPTPELLDNDPYPHVDDIQRLKMFLQASKESIQKVIDNYDDLFPENPELKGSLEFTWNEIRSQFDDIIENKLKADRKLYNKLRKSGLTENQLTMKLWLLEIARAEAEFAEQVHKIAKDEYEKEKEENRFIKFVKDPYRYTRNWWKNSNWNLLDAICTVFDSLIAIVGGGEAVKEFKGLLKNRLSN